MRLFNMELPELQINMNGSPEKPYVALAIYKYLVSIFL